MAENVADVKNNISYGKLIFVHMLPVNRPSLSAPCFTIDKGIVIKLPLVYMEDVKVHNK